MRYTSSGRKILALLLSLILFRNGGSAGLAAAAAPDEPCILLKLAAVSIPQDVAKEKLAALQTSMKKALRVRWVEPAAADVAVTETAGELPPADGEAIEAIRASLGEAIRRMDRMETKEAKKSLSEAETIARSFRFGEATRPYLAEVFLRRGLLLLWEGETEKAESMLARSRVLRPEFTPDPAIFSPLFLEAWAGSGKRTVPRAEILVNSLPSGAMIHLNGKEAGTTPGRIHVDATGLVRIQVRADGYLPGERKGQWLPGDTEVLDFHLVRDRYAPLSELLSSSPDGKETGPLLSRMMTESGARRVALLLLVEEEAGAALRIYSMAQEDAGPVEAGTVGWPEGEEGNAQVASFTVEALRNAGWPGQPGTDTEVSSWYHTWWFWTILGVAAAGIAAGAGGSGGGGSSGSSTGTIGVNF